MFTAAYLDFCKVWPVEFKKKLKKIIFKKIKDKTLPLLIFFPTMP